MNKITDIAVMNAVVREEILRQQARRRAETERARTVQASRNRLLARKMAALNRRLNRKPNLLQRLLRPVVNTWAMYYAVWTNAPEIFLNWCEAMGWIERVEVL